MKIDLTQLTGTQIFLSFLIVIALTKIFFEVFDLVISKLNGYHKNRNHDEKITETIAAHTKIIEELTEKCKMLSNEMKKMELRLNITAICNSCLSKGSITSNEFKMLEGLYAEYQELGGNGYIKTLMEKIRALPIKED